MTRKIANISNLVRKVTLKLSSGAGVGDAPPQVLICQNFGQNLKKLGKDVFTFFKIINQIIFLSYLAYK